MEQFPPNLNDMYLYVQSLRSGQTASYMFEIGVNEVEDKHPTRLEFSVTFSPLSKSQPPELYKYYFSLNQFKVSS